jgi:hypothetical protein
MRAGGLIAVLALLTACKPQPDFDARYDKAAKEIEARAKAMDASIAESAPQGLPDVGKPSNPAASSGE